MIIVDSRHLRFLRAGRTITVAVPRPYRVGHDYAAGHRHNRVVCRVLVQSCAPAEGGFELELRQHRLDEAVYLARSPGVLRADYTSNPMDAAREADGSPIEAVDRGRLQRQAAEAFARDDLIRRERAAESLQRLTRRYAVASSLPVVVRARL